MDDAVFDWVERLVEESLQRRNETSDWDHRFMTDQQTRLKEWGSNTKFSPKQWDALDRIARKLDFEERPDAGNEG